MVVPPPLMRTARRMGCLRVFGAVGVMGVNIHDDELR